MSDGILHRHVETKYIAEFSNQGSTLKIVMIIGCYNPEVKGLEAAVKNIHWRQRYLNVFS